MTALKDHMTKNLHTTSDFGVQDMLTKAAKYAQDLETQSLLPTFLDPRYFKAMTSANRKVATTLSRSCSASKPQKPQVQEDIHL